MTFYDGKGHWRVEFSFRDFEVKLRSLTEKRYTHITCLMAKDNTRAERTSL